jgi:RNA ligase (TIGR02306 family)
MERQLATIVRIESLESIPNADAIELARMVDKGWQVVVKKGEFKVGDLAVYFEIDSFLPIRPEFEFLRKSCLRTMNGKEGLRLKTIKLRGTLSQGLLLPMSVMANHYCPLKDEYFEGDDVTEILGIDKYEAELSTGARLGGDIKGTFPSWIPKTDEERIQNMHGKNRLKINSTVFYVTEKLEGSSFTCYLQRYSPTVEGQGEAFGVCSRNMELKESEDNAYWQAARNLQLHHKLMKYLMDHPEVFNIALQGELVGPGVQGNIYKLPERTVKFFGAIVNGRKLDYYSLENLFHKELKLEMVPVVRVSLWGCGVNDYTTVLTNATTEDILREADGKSALNPNQDREGLVFRALDGSISFKAISNKYLLGDKS